MYFHNLKNFIKEKIDYLLAFFAPFFAFVLSVSITKPIYLINDDFVMRSFIEGRYLGIHAEFTLFINFLYMKILKFLYILNENLPWYDILFGLFIFISFFVITLFTNKTLNNKFAKFINSFILLIFAFNFFTTFQFTLVSEILAISCAVMAGYIFITNDKSVLKTALCFIYILFASTFSSLIRVEPMQFVLLLSIIFSVFFIKKIQFSKKKIYLIILLILTFFINGELHKYNISEHNKNLPNFVEYNSILAMITDNSIYTSGDKNLNDVTNDILPELANNHYSANDFKLLVRWYSTANSIYSGENINSLYKSIKSKISINKDKNYIINKGMNLFHKYFFEKKVILLQLILISILSILFFRKYYIFNILVIHFLMILLISYFGILMKPLPFRVYYPLLVFEYAIMLMFAKYYEAKNLKPLNLIRITSVLILLGLFSHICIYEKIKNNNRTLNNYTAIKNYDFSNYKYIFVEPLMGKDLLIPYDMNYTKMDTKIFYNWNVYSKYYRYKLQRLNLEKDLFENLLNDDVYLLGIKNVTPISDLQQSLKEHQHVDTNIVKAAAICENKIFLYKFIPTNQKKH